MTQYTVTATATSATTNRITVDSAENMFSGMPIVFSGTTFGGITAGATYYIGTIIVGYPTSTITVTSLPGGAVYTVTSAVGSMTGTFSSGGQQIINTVPPGESLNTAFNSVNLNFDQIFAAGPVGSNIQIANNTIKTTNTNGNLVLAPNGVGKVQANVDVVPNTSNIRNLGSSSQRWASVYTQYLDISGTVAVDGDLSVNGNLSVTGNIIQVGNIVTDSKTIQLANTASTANAANGSGITVGSNDNIATFLYDSSANAWSTGNIIPMANVTYSLGNSTRQWKDLYVSNSTIYLNNVPISLGVGNVLTVNGEPVLVNDSNTTITTTGNITADYFIGDGSLLTGIGSSYGNANVATFLAAYGSNTISTTGNVRGGNLLSNQNISATGNVSGTYFFGDASLMSGVITGNTLSDPVLYVASDTVTLPALNSAGYAVGNVPGNPITWLYDNNTISWQSNQNVTPSANASKNLGTSTLQWGNLYVANVLATTVSATGNITGNYFIGNGSQLTGIATSTGNIGFTGDAIYDLNGIILENADLTHGATAAVVLPANGNTNPIQVNNTYGNITLQSGSNASITASWTFDNTGNLTVPSSINLPSNGAVTFTSGSHLTFGDTPVTNRYYIDATRTDTYTQNGSQSRPFKTIAAAQAAIATAIGDGLNPEVEPVYMILLSNITENVTLATNHVYLIGQNGQIHQPIILTGNITVEPTSGTLNSNHFSISGMEIVGGTNGKAIYVTGTYPTRLSLQDVWITANGTGAGLYQDNTGTGTYTHGGPLKVSHNGSGDVYCFDIRKGTASFDTVETSGATQVGAAGPGATLTFNNSQLDASGDVVVETYGSGVLVVTNSVIKNAAANSYGIKLNAVANVAGTVSVGQSAFNVPAGTGQAVWLDPNTTPGLSGVFAWSGASFYPSTNTTISPTIIPGPLAILVGTQVSPIFYGDITSYAVAQDWDLIDNNASALSFDTTGKAGVLELVTTNSAEGVKMSGYANVVGNVTGGNILTAGIMSSTGNATHGNLSVTGNVTGNTAGYAIGYRDIPQVSFTGNATITTTDAGKHYYSTLSTGNVLTIANNASQGFQVGAAITIINQGTGNITVAQGSGVTLYLAGNVTAGNRSVATFGMATLIKVATDTWFINGTGVS